MDEEYRKLFKLNQKNPYSRSPRPLCGYCCYLQFPSQVCFSATLPELVFTISLPLLAGKGMFSSCDLEH